MRYLYILLLAVPLASCKTPAPVLEQRSDSTTYQATIKDTAVYTAPDSALIRYYLECQQTADGYKAVIKQLLDQQPGERLNTPTADIKDNVLTARAYLPGQTLYIPVYRYYSSSVKAAVYVRYTNYLTWYQKYLMYAGGGFLLYLCFLLYKLVRRFI